MNRNNEGDQPHRSFMGPEVPDHDCRQRMRWSTTCTTTWRAVLRFKGNWILEEEEGKDLASCKLKKYSEYKHSNGDKRIAPSFCQVSLWAYRFSDRFPLSARFFRLTAFLYKLTA